MSEFTRMDEKLLTVQEVAEILRVQPSTIYKWASAEKIPCTRLGRKTLLFRHEDVSAWIAAQTRKSQSASRS